MWMVWIFWSGSHYDGTAGLEGLLNSYSRSLITRDQLNTMANQLEELNTDWFKILFRNAYTQTHNLSVSGGTEKTNYYISLNYNGEEGGRQGERVQELRWNGESEYGTYSEV